MLNRILLAALVALVPSVAFGQVLHWGDFQDGDTEPFVFDFDTLDPATGEPVSPVGLTLIVRELGATTEDSDCITFNDNADGRTGNHEATVDLTDTYFQPGKRYSALITAGTAGGVDIFPRKIASWSTNQYSAAPTNFESLSVDGSGAVIIQDGTDPGQIATTSGAIDTVTTTGTVTNGVNVTQFGGTNGTFSGGIPAVNSTQWGGTAVASANVRADVRQILGTTLTDVGSGDFGSTLAGNFSILFGQSTNESNTAIGASEINNILTRTNRIPNVAAGSSGGILIAGSNAPTTFSTLTSTGAMSINGVSNVAQTGDSFARLGAPAGASHAADIADLPNVTEFNAGLAALPQTGDLATPAEINAEVEAGQVGTDTAAIVAKLPTAGAKMAGEGATAKNLDEIEASGGGGSTQPRINRKPDPGFTIQVSRRADGTYKCTKPIRLTAGAINAVYAFIDMAPLFGAENFVETVGAPVVSGGSVTASATGPRDTYAIVELDGTATAGEERTVTVPVTMTSGTQLNVVFDLEVFE